MTKQSTLVSICIPVKDFDVNPLANALLDEIRTFALPAEVLILEDGSSEAFCRRNVNLAQEPEITICTFSENRGRSAARNRLAIEAKGKYLLFLDADSLPLNKVFIKKYLAHAKSNTILCGGRHYSPLYMTKDSVLHWKFGTQRELFSALGKENTNFYSNNFFIEKSAFEQILFNDKIVLYGHEDTLFGYTAKSKGFTIELIENAIVHTSLESNEVFLAKTEESILSLVEIMKGHKEYANDLKNEFKIWKVYDFIYRNHLQWILKLLSPLKKTFKYLLLNFSGPLRILDLYKLILLDEARSKKL
jgi:GT2 family glycosyltransferase